MTKNGYILTRCATAIIAIDMKTWENVLLDRFYDDDYQNLAYFILIAAVYLPVSEVCLVAAVYLPVSEVWLVAAVYVGHVVEVMSWIFIMNTGSRNKILPFYTR